MDRIQKILSAAGVASRRKAEELILDGRITVNGKIVTELGTKVDTKKDKVYFDDNLVKVENHKRYILLNKPEGYISSSVDQFDNLSVSVCAIFSKTNEFLELEKPCTAIKIVLRLFTSFCEKFLTIKSLFIFNTPLKFI